MKYGMRYDSIRHWQNDAKSFALHNGRAILFCGLQYRVSPAMLDSISSRELAHYIIGIATIASTDEIKSLLR